MPAESPEIQPRSATVYSLDLRAHAQILTRAEAQLETLSARGLAATGLCFDRGLAGSLPHMVEGIPSRGPRLVRGLLAAKRMRRRLQELDPTVVILRYGFASRSTLNIAKQFPVVLEIHIDDTAEYPRNPLISTYARISNLVFRRRLMALVRGAVFVNDELAQRPAFASIGGPRAVVPNGIPVPEFPVPSPNNARPVVGYSVGYRATWQGLDRLALLSNALPEFDFHLLVPALEVAEELPADCRVSVIVTTNPDDYRRQVEGFDVALGTLALDRKGLASSSSLKVRESIALGIPTVLFSRDDDLSTGQPKMVLALENARWDDGSVFNRVREFVVESQGLRVPDNVRAIVDIRQKASAYADLVERVVHAESPDVISEPRRTAH